MSLLRGLSLSGLAAALLVMTASTADAGLLGLVGCCDSAPACCEPEPACCEPAPVCCEPPPPVSVTWCVQDPCDPCASYEVTACVPACCAGQVPCLDGWRRGFLGRKVLTYKFPGCDHCVEVVIRCLGGAFVR